MSQVNYGIMRGEREAQRERPAKLTYGGVDIPCSPGNLNFFMRLKADGGGFQGVQGLFVKILREDIPDQFNDLGVDAFHSGHNITVTNLDPESPECGETFDLVVGQNNQWTAQMVLLNLEKLLA
jgi:hypothetical protein